MPQKRQATGIKKRICSSGLIMLITPNSYPETMELCEVKISFKFEVYHK